MTARKPLVPPELRELLTALRDLAERPPSPRRSQPVQAWDRHRYLGIDRQSLLRVQLGSLVARLADCEKYPGVAAEILARECAYGIERVRELLAEPLGYEVAKETGDG